jgi:hypothetical protein
VALGKVKVPDCCWAASGAASAIAAAQTEADKWRAGKRIMARWGSSNGSGMPGLVEGAE